MNYRFLVGGAVVLALGLPGMAWAQQKPPPAAPAQAGSTGQQQPAQQVPSAPLPPLIASQWTKLCNTPQQGGVKVCLTGHEVRADTGLLMVSTTMVEPEGNPKKVLRVTVPAPMYLPAGIRMVLDQNPPLASQIFTCIQTVCIADYDVTDDLLGRLKKGTTLTVQFLTVNGQQANVPTALADFAKAHDGPPTDQKVFEEQQKKFQDQFKKPSQ
jgi:invasion protein IalB